MYTAEVVSSFNMNTLYKKIEVQIWDRKIFVLEILHHRMQCKAISEGVWWKEFKDLKIEYKNNRGDQTSTYLQKNERVFEDVRR